MDVYPGDPEVNIKQIHSLDKEGWNLRYLQFSSHAGTHSDAFSHMDENGRTIDDIPIERFIGKTVVVKTGGKFPTGVGLAFSEGKMDLNLFEKIKGSGPLFVIVGKTAELSVELE